MYEENILRFVMSIKIKWMFILIYKNGIMVCKGRCIYVMSCR